MKFDMGELVARRSLKIAGSTRRVTVYLGKPRLINESGQTYYTGIYHGNDNTKHIIDKGVWLCPYKISGLPLENISKNYYAEALGQDSMDALISAIYSIIALLDRCKPALQWSHSWGFDPGFPIIVETLGINNKSEVLNKILHMISREHKLQSKRPRPPWVLNVYKKLKIFGPEK